MLEFELSGADGVSPSKPGPGGCEQRVFSERLLKYGDAFDSADHAPPDAHNAGAQIQVVSFEAGFVTPAAAPQVQPQVIHNRHGNLILDGEHIGQFAIEPARP